MDQGCPPYKPCLCGAHRFKRVTVERKGQALYITDFLACKECGAMYHWPASNGILPASPERTEFLRQLGFLETIDPRNVRPAMKPKNRDRVDATDPLDMRYWTSALLCSNEELRAAIAAVGPGIVEVRRFLRGNA